MSNMGWLSLVLSGGAINYLLRQISEMIVGLYISMKLGRVLHKHETWQGIPMLCTQIFLSLCGTLVTLLTLNFHTSIHSCSIHVTTCCFVYYESVSVIDTRAILSITIDI